MVDDKLAAALRTAMEQHLDAQRIREVYSRFEGSGKRLILFKTGKVIARSEDSIERVLVLLDGTCNVLKHSSDGRTVLAGTVQAPQIFGLFELLNNMTVHTADIETVTDCLCFSISPDLYRDQYEKNMEVMRYSSKFLACFIDQLLEKSDRMTLNSDRQNLLLYCLEACRDESFPVVIAVRKETLAASLNMNLRTLYHKIGQLKDEGLIGSQKGKIRIDREQHARLKQELNEII